MRIALMFGIVVLVAVGCSRSKKQAASQDAELRMRIAELDDPDDLDAQAGATDKETAPSGNLSSPGDR